MRLPLAIKSVLLHSSVLLALGSTTVAGQHYSPAAEQSYPNTVYWGDTHLHSNLSIDAYTKGNRNLGLDAAYRFAKGDAVQASNGMMAKRKRPLDFLVIADHASNMGLMQHLESSPQALPATPLAQHWLQQFNKALGLASSNPKEAKKLSADLLMDGWMAGNVLDHQTQQTIWTRAIALADQYNQPGQFTAFIGYEWTQVFYNLHRVVIFKDDARKAGQVRPFSQYDSSDPEALWAYLAAYENQTGGEVLAIPHNGNMSNGVMFALEGADGQALTVDYAKQRSRWEPLFEVTQIKGDSEAHPELSPQDDFADFETFFTNSLHRDSVETLKTQRELSDYDTWIQQKKVKGDPLWNYQYGYARPGLKLGLQQQAKLGVNPFKFGLIGSTDSHTSLAIADEDNFWGKNSQAEPSPTRLLNSWAGTAADPDDNSYFARAWNMNAAGYAAVWAEENTRPSLFAAMKRKEVYASTGPRITVRFFGGWDYHAEDAVSANLAQIGYQKGVPMGGDLSQAPVGEAPRFLIHATRDPEGANLDRLQIIKGWHDAQGQLHEKVYDVALSDDRRPNWRGKVNPVGNTVDIANASYTNTIGDPELSVVWQDPQFNADELAFYYVRVLEIPTPRWPAYDAKFFNVSDIPDDAPMITQERAYTSPIWYTPNNAHRK